MPRPCSIESQKVSEKKMNTKACCRELIRVEDQVAEVFWFSIGWLMVAEGVRRAIYGKKKERGPQSVAPLPFPSHPVYAPERFQTEFYAKKGRLSANIVSYTILSTRISIPAATISLRRRWWARESFVLITRLLQRSPLIELHSTMRIRFLSHRFDA